jgi:hypothetical protein
MLTDKDVQPLVDDGVLNQFEGDMLIAYHTYGGLMAMILEKLVGALGRKIEVEIEHAVYDGME